MSKKITPNLEHHPLRENKIAKRVYGLLFKKEMSVKELAQTIYKKKNNRNEITKWIKYFRKKGWIDDVKSLEQLREKRYSSNLNPFLEDSGFDKNEIEFIEIFMRRFWNADRYDILESFVEILVEATLIKEIHKFKKRLIGYNPEKDLENYKRYKKEFWNNKTFRDDFLDKIRGSGARRERSMKPIIKRDFLFLSLLIPNSVINKVGLKFRLIGDPLSTIMTLLKID